MFTDNDCYTPPSQIQPTRDVYKGPFVSLHYVQIEVDLLHYYIILRARMCNILWIIITLEISTATGQKVKTFPITPYILYNTAVLYNRFSIRE